MAATRLRRAFRYPEDSGDEVQEREELDEEEQERVIEHLQRQNERRNAEYSMVFTALPLLSMILFVPSMLSQSSTPAVRFLSFLGIVSLANTAYIIRHFSLPLPDRKGKRPAAEVERAMSVRKALLSMNSVLCGLLVLVYLFASPSSQSIWPALYLVPGAWQEKRHDEDHLGSCHAAMFAIILIAREAMISVDLSHLEDLRYEYKGA